MSVIGLDLGNQSCFVAVARGGGIETVANEYSDRSTPSIVSLGPKQRFIGSAAKQQVVTNFKNTATNFRNLLGLKFSDPAVAHELRFSNFSAEETQDGDVGIHMEYLGEACVFKPEQVVAMLLTQLKKVGEMNLSGKVSDCVISVPCFFDDRQRRALLDAAATAGLNCLRLMNDTTATALAYGIYKQDLPAPEEKPRNVVFVDMGNSALRVTLASFIKGKLKVLATAWDSKLGGRDFDERIQKHFNEEFKNKYKVDASTKPRPRIRLSQESEKIKKLMSANTTPIPMNIECFMDDKDVTAKMKRSEMEELCADLLARLEVPMKKVLTDSGLSPKDLYSVEVVGGSTRVPAVRDAIKRVFGLELSTTLNQDEAVARGCALQCAMLSPTFKVREFKVEDVVSYPIRLTWKPSCEEEEAEMDVFPPRQAYPYSKMLSFFRREPFFIHAQYADGGHTDPNIGRYTIAKVVPTSEGEASKVKVKVRVNIHGIFNVTSAVLVEKITAEDAAAEPEDSTAGEPSGEAATSETQNGAPEGDQPMDVDETPATEATDSASAPAAAAEDASGNGDDGSKKSESEPPKKKVKVKSHDLPIDARVEGGSTHEALTRLIERENEMISQDRLEKERADAKNAVEEYVYEMREKISSTLSDFISGPDSEKFSAALTACEDWLYEEGEEVSRQIYVDKLGELQKTGEPIKMRARESSERQPAFDTLGKTIVHYRKILSLCGGKDEKYEHLSADDIKSVAGHVEAKQVWMHERMAEVAKLNKFDNPPFLSTAILTEKTALENLCNPVVNKPKPKVEPPKDAKPAETAPAPEAAATAEQSQPAPATANIDADLD
ncbi:heat shock 70 kDa protein 4-like [Sycon ciliatum]|uniref:heat shock 70 kDa protein 4-like n=1 Tax=Sycon ciliatum TaxID=27933 RepID=UPI0020A96CB2|eukprot:scpid37720/ scgid33665/ Heat shock 70 kDa protein 4; Ischemia responsive 94 kDa protein